MPTSPTALVKANFTKRKELMGELAQIDEACTTDSRSYTEAETARIDEVRNELAAIDNRITGNVELQERSEVVGDAIERMLGNVVAREGNGGFDEARSLGEQFADENYRSWVKAGGRGQHLVEMPGLSLRAVTDATTGVTSAGALVQPTRLARVGQDFIDRKVYLIDLLQHIPIGTGSVEYVQDKSPLADLANKAVEVSEAGTKPQAGITTQVITESAATIAAWANITRQALADVPQIQAYLDTRLRYSLKRRADAQAINGGGISPNLLGLAGRTGIITYAPGAEARYVSIRHTIRLMEDAETVPEIIVLNPADAELFDLSNSTSAGLHAVNAVSGDLQNGTSVSAWGMRQVRSTAIASGTALLIDPTAVAVFDRQEVTAYVTDSHASNFTSNIVTLLLEARLGLGLFDPAGVGKVTFSGTT